MAAAQAATPEPSIRSKAQADEGVETAADGSEETASSKKVSPTERRRAAMLLVDVWHDMALDLRRAELGEVRRLHDPTLLEEIVEVAGRLQPASMAGFLPSLDRASRAIEGNASPELALDVLVLAWPRATLVA